MTKNQKPVTRRDLGLERQDGHSSTEFAAHKNTAASAAAAPLTAPQQAIADAEAAWWNAIDEKARVMIAAQKTVDDAKVALVSARITAVYPDAVSAKFELTGVQSGKSLRLVEVTAGNGSQTFTLQDGDATLYNQVALDLKNLHDGFDAIPIDTGGWGGRGFGTINLGHKHRADAAFGTAAGELDMRKMMPGILVEARKLQKLDDEKLATITDDDLNFVYNTTLALALGDLRTMEASYLVGQIPEDMDGFLREVTVDAPVMHGIFAQLKDWGVLRDENLAAVSRTQATWLYNSYVKGPLEDFAYDLWAKYGNDTEEG
ncbi:hypothetical protein [Leifsonia sp. Leaf264]|uniref:hypothetical protein n=1 Tax=Leifsonia sp. Leaf264 TaxID=1736314 RepID=UPI0006FB3E00|nr:hypothetical protein [Leifsonia sp. Leaf264]KQO98600.1 hypothetical protein ASF30_11095 [Leifsonia sp. Leaf264]